VDLSVRVFFLQLYIRKAQAFVLVYSITDENSFLEVKNLWEQIKKVRPNILDVPCVIVENNLDEENGMSSTVSMYVS
jgi:GTPase SAR1 family protein